MADNSAQFTIDLVAKDGGIKSAAEALDQYTRRLTESSSAVEAANAALRAGEQAYKQSETAADRAAKALERVNLQAESQQEKMRKAMEANNPAAFWRAATALENLKQRQQEVGAVAEAAKATLSEQAASVDRLRAAAESAVQTEQRFANAVAQTKKDLDARNAAMKAAAAEDAKFAAEGAQAAQIYMNLFNQQAKQQQAAKSATESAAQKAAGAINKLSGAASDSKFKANEAAEAFGKLGGPLGAAGQKVLSLQSGFEKLGTVMGEGGPYVAAAVAIVAVTAAVVALTAAAAYGIFQIALWGVQLADTTHQLDALNKRFHDTIAKTFGGLNIDKLLDQLGSLVDLFDTSTASGRAMQSVFNSIFQPLIDGAAAMVPTIRRAFLELEIWLLKSIIWMKQNSTIVVAVGEAFLVLAAAITLGLVVALGALAIGLAIPLLPFVALLAAIGAVVAAIVWAGKAIYDFFSNFSIVDAAVAAVDSAGKAILEFFAGFSLVDAGMNLIKGFAAGIANAASLVIDAAKSVATGAVTAVQNALKIHSPSLVFQALGQNTGEGMAQGIDKSSDAVQASMQEMTAPPAVLALDNIAPATPKPETALESISPPTAKPETALDTKAAKSGGNTFSITIQAPDGQAETLAGKVREVLLEVLEGDAAQLGSAVPT